MPTVAEILKSSGMTDEQIAALDAKATGAFTQILSTADQTLAAAELANRSVKDTLANEINPALDKWANDSATLSAERDYYKTLAEKAKEGGFTPGAEPFKPAARTADGKFVSGANPVPGSPDFVANLRNEVGGAFAFVADTSWKYRTLFGTELPDSPTELIKEATAQHLSPSAWAAKKYDFAGKENAIKAEAQKKHDDAIRKEASDAKDKEWSEKVGNNPNIRQAEVSKFSVLNKAVKANERPDPLKMSPEQRHASTRAAIHKDIAQSETVN